MVIRKLSGEKREAAVWWIFAISQLSFAASRILTHFAGEQLAFFIGMMSGFSMVGNLFSLWQFTRMKLLSK